MGRRGREDERIGDEMRGEEEEMRGKEWIRESLINFRNHLLMMSILVGSTLK